MLSVLSLVQPAHSLEGVGSSHGITGRSVSVGGVRHGHEGSISIGVGEVAGLGISAPLADTLGRPGHEGGGSSGVSGNSRQTVSVAVGVGVAKSVPVGSVEVGGVSLSISAPLASAAEASGLAEGGGHSRPVGVGVVEGGVGSVEVARVGLGLAGGNRDDGSSNQKLEHGEDDDTTHCGVRAVVMISAGRPCLIYQL